MWKRWGSVGKKDVGVICLPPSTFWVSNPLWVADPESGGREE